jgi:hypothetical protein
MAVQFFRGQQLGRNDLFILLTNSADRPTNASSITYAIYDYTTGVEAVVGSPFRIPANPSIGEYYASIIIPLDANMGTYRIRWTFQEVVGGPKQEVVQEFAVSDKMTVDTAQHFTSDIVQDLIRRLRILLRDNNPDRNYHFRPPAHEETVGQFNRVFGFIWEDGELDEYIQRALDMIIAYPPRTPFSNVEQMIQMRREWTTVLLTGAMLHALQALRINWVADEFEYSIGGVSLNLDKATKYEAAYTASSEQFDKQLEKAKATVNFVRGLQQPKFGTGIRSAFGPFVGRGVLSPRKFVGF